MSQDNIPWLAKLEQYEQKGVFDDPEHPNPIVLQWARGPGHFPDMDTDHYAPWCGIGMAGVMHEVGMDSAIPDSPALAISWLNCGEECDPKPGAIVVFGRIGGNHVSCIKSVDGNQLECIGCNQSHAIKTSVYNLNNVKGIRWPKGAAAMNAPVVVKSPYYDLLQYCQVKPEWQNRIDNAAQIVVKNMDRYKEVEDATGVPWAFVGVLHMRESSNDFSTHLHNGDPLTGRTTHVPAGRPPEWPPEDGTDPWVASAIDALDYEGFADKGDWTLENICDRAEHYNGLGYRRMGIPSPYLWSGTNIYTRGKYVADGQFSSSAVDRQCGVIPVYLRAMDLAHEKVIRDSSTKIGFLTWIRNSIKGLIGAIGGLFTASNMTGLQQVTGWLQPLFEPKVLIPLLLGGVAIWAIVNVLENMMVQDAKAGTWAPSGTATSNAPPLKEQPANVTTPTPPATGTP